MSFEQLNFHLRRGVPIIGMSVSDQVDYATLIAKEAPDKGNDSIGVVKYDSVAGFTGLNESGKSAVASYLPPEHLKSIKSNNGRNAVVPAIDLARYFPKRTIVIWSQADFFFGVQGFLQGIQNLRDEYKKDRRMLVLLSSSFIVPEMLANDVVVLESSNPTREQLKEMAARIAKSGDLKNYEVSEEEIDAINGLPMFQAEQAAALAITKDGFDVQKMLELKKQLIGSTPGLSVWNKRVTFNDVGGLDGIKNFFSRIFNGPKPPQTLVWLDEIEKSAIANTGDSNGINADMLGTMLSYMEDEDVYGVMFNGVPGAGKSIGVQAVGGQFDRLVLKLDLSGMRGQYVGQSERNLRSALRIIREVSDGNAMFIATSNWIENLDVALQSRFSDKFFFDLPTHEELASVWNIHKKKYGFENSKTPRDVGWVGRNVHQCCRSAWMTMRSLVEVAKEVVPAAVVSKKEITKLQESAKGRFLCASTGGIVE